MRIKNYKMFLESKKVIFDKGEAPSELTQDELDVIAKVVNYFDSEAEIDDHPGWTEVETFVSEIEDDKIILGITYGFNHTDGEETQKATEVIIDRNTLDWVYEPKEEV